MAGKQSKFWEDNLPALERMARDGKSDQQIADALGISKAAAKQKRQEKRIPAGGELRRGLHGGMQLPELKPFDRDPLPSPITNLDELLRRRRLDFSRKHEAKQARRLVDVRVLIDGPFGVMHMGDPHLDDPGTDILTLERHLEVARRTEGLFAGNVGDYQNNWVGRLARLWASQATTQAESWLLVEWLVRGCDWLYLVGGNHDAWSGDSDPLRWIASQQDALLEPAGLRLNLRTPSGRAFRVNARHDFPGRSIYNIAHGPGRAAQFGWRDHVLTCGHLHASGHMVLRDPMSGLISHAFRVASYKTYDQYAEDKGLPDARIFVAPVTIFNPAWPDDDNRCVSFHHDPEDAAEYLTWLRSRQKGSGRAA